MVYDGLGWFPQTDPFFTDLSGLTLQSGVGVGPGGRLVKDEYTVGGGGGGTGGTAAGVGVSTGMDIDGEMNQTIQHHPPQAQAPAVNNTQPQQSFIPGLATSNPGVHIQSIQSKIQYMNFQFVFQFNFNILLREEIVNFIIFR